MTTRRLKMAFIVWYCMVLSTPLRWFDTKVVIKSDLHRPCAGRSEKRKFAPASEFILSFYHRVKSSVQEWWSVFGCQPLSVFLDLNIQSSSLFSSKIYFSVCKLSFLIYFLKSQNLDLRSFAAQSNCGDCIENLDCRAKLDLQDCSQVVL